jgi:preprotein translocase subunit SecA
MMREFISDSVSAFMPKDGEWDEIKIRSHLFGLVADGEIDTLKEKSESEIADLLTERALSVYCAKEKEFSEAGIDMREVERNILLRNVDRAWMDQIDAMDDLKGSVGLNSYAQRDPINEYRIIGAQMFESMTEEIRDNTVRMVLTVTARRPVERVAVAKPTAAGFADGTVKKKPTVKKQKIGRNDPCPCGSGKKYKQCCLSKDEG